MAKKREPNPYTKYGRKRIRMEMDPTTKKESEWMTAGCLLIVAVIGSLIAFLFGGMDAVIDWLS